MDLEQAQELFSAYREGDLPPDEVKAFEGLLASDAEAQEEYDKFCRTLESLALLSKEPAPDDFVEKLQGRMRRRSGGKLFGANRWGHVTRVPYELFSLVLILIILTVYMLLLPVSRIAAPATPSVPPETENGASQGDGER